MIRKTVDIVSLLAAAGLLVAVGSGCDDRAEHAPAQAAEPVAPAEKNRANAGGGSEHYAIDSPDRAVPVAQKAQTEIEIRPKGELKINEEFPWRLEFTDNPRVELAQGSYAKGDFELSEESATLPLLVEADEAGEHALEAIADFSVCTDTECFVMRDEPLSFMVEAHEEETPDDSK